MNRRTGLLALSAAALVAAFAYYWLRPSVDLYSVAVVFNADSTAARLSFGDSASTTPELIAPRSMGRSWPVETAFLFIERDIAGADPLVFDLRPHLSMMGSEYVLALHGTSLFVVERDSWPQPDPKSAAHLGRIAAAILAPLD